MASETISESLLIRDTRPYVLWRRVSTDEQGESGLGLEAQVTIARLFTQRDPVAVFTDVYTGTKLRECTELWAAVDYCKANECLLVIAKTDRFRNVRDALEVLDAVGEGNLSFCDLPMASRMVLTIMFSVWESQAMMGKINTKMALAERRKQLEEHGGWISKSGRWTTHFGRAKGCDLTTAHEARARSSVKKAAEWRENSVGYKWVRRQLVRGVPRKEIIEEFNENMRMGMEGFTTPKGRPLSKGVLSVWAAELKNAGKL